MLQDQEMVPEIPPKSGEPQGFCFTKAGVQVWDRAKFPRTECPPALWSCLFTPPQAALRFAVNTGPAIV